MGEPKDAPALERPRDSALLRLQLAGGVVSARFEVVRTDAEQPWHARLVAGNNETVWTTEKYASKAGAENAIRVLGDLTRADFHKAFDNVLEVDERQPLTLCPECAQGKTVNCTTIALDPELDDFVPCANAKAGES